MQSEVMGKTLAMFMVIAMIATGIAMLPAGTVASGYTVTGHIVDDVTSEDIVGVKVTISNETIGIEKSITSLSGGIFTTYVNQSADFDVTYEMDGYKMILGTTDNNGALKATDFPVNETTVYMDPILLDFELEPSITGTVTDMDGSTPIEDVEVTISNGTSGDLINTVMTDVNGEYTYPTNSSFVDLYFIKNGYYYEMLEDVKVNDTGETEVDAVMLTMVTPTPSIPVWGRVLDNKSQQPVEGALVSISEGNEYWIGAISDDSGRYEMEASPGNYQIKASRTGYYTTVDPVWVEVPSDGAAKRNMVLKATPKELLTLTGTITNSTGNVGSADVYLHSADGSYVNHTTTKADGTYSMKFYDDAPNKFRLEVRKAGYFTDAETQKNIDNVNLTGDVVLKEINQNMTIQGVVYGEETQYYIDGASVTLYDMNHLYVDSAITANGGTFMFGVHYMGNFTLVVNADGYQSEKTVISNVMDTVDVEFELKPSPTDLTHTVYTFANWTSITVNQSRRIDVDNVSARVDAVRKWGMGPQNLDLFDDIVSGTVISEWQAYLEGKGVEQRDTSEFLTLNNTYYKLDINSYNVSLEGAAGNSTIYINNSYKYDIVGDLDNINSDIFELSLNASYDTQYEDFVYDIVIQDFEMTGNITETNNVLVTGYNDPITINPAIFDGDMEEITMTLQRSMNGTAMASVISGDHYYVLNSTYNNYTVMVAQGGSGGFDTTVTFSAQDSTDTIGDIDMANFTWDFGDGETGWGMEVEHNFTAVDGNVTATLTITETGGNVTTRNFYVWIDSQNPTAGISVITTDADNVSVVSGVLTVNEDLPLTFSGIMFSDAEGMDDETITGTASSDELEDGDGGMGTIEKWFWSWGDEESPDETITMDGSNNITHTYTEPGTYYLNLITTDVVGHESETANWTVNVIDKTAPTPMFSILDNGTVVTEVVENIEYTYDASPSTDNIDDVADLSFSWIINIDGQELNYTGETINFTSNQVGEFNITLFATDTVGNEANTTQIVHVNLGERPNILMKVGSLTFDPEKGTAGSSMKVSINLTNDGDVDATNIQVTFYIRNADETDTEIGTTTISTLAAGDDTEASITWTPGKKGEYSLWANATCAQEHESQYWDNSIQDFSTQTITIAEASWVIPAIVIGIIAVVIVVFFGFRYFMQNSTESEKSGEKRKKR